MIDRRNEGGPPRRPPPSETPDGPPYRTDSLAPGASNTSKGNTLSTAASNLNPVPSQTPSILSNPSDGGSIIGGPSSIGGGQVAAASTQTGYWNPVSTSKPGDYHTDEPWEPSPPPFRIALAAAIPITLIAMGIILACIVRRKRKQRQLLNQVAAKLSVRQQPSQHQHSIAAAALSYPGAPQPSSQMHLTASGGAAPPPPPSSVPAAAPVVISPMAPGMSNAYFTGIDTSDAVSVVSHSLPPNPYAFDPEHGDEPPPPYRPRSVAPISRETSVRLPETVRGSRMLTPPPEEHRTRSPFDDPEDDDDDEATVFGSGASRARSQDDRMSDVSDLSYQGPTTAHHSV